MGCHINMGLSHYRGHVTITWGVTLTWVCHIFEWHNEICKITSWNNQSSLSWSHYFSLVMSIWLSLKESVRSQQTEERERQKTFSIQQSQTFCMSSIQPHFKTSTTAAAETEKELRPRLRKSWHFKVKHPGSQAKLFWQSGSRTARAILGTVGVNHLKSDIWKCALEQLICI